MEESCLGMFRKHRGKFSENFWSAVEQGVGNCTRRNALRSMKRILLLRYDAEQIVDVDYSRKRKLTRIRIVCSTDRKFNQV